VSKDRVFIVGPTDANKPADTRYDVCVTKFRGKLATAYDEHLFDIAETFYDLDAAKNFCALVGCKRPKVL
jgi:hypothetical protein